MEQLVKEEIRLPTGAGRSRARPHIVRRRSLRLPRGVRDIDDKGLAKFATVVVAASSQPAGQRQRMTAACLDGAWSWAGLAHRNLFVRTIIDLLAEAFGLNFSGGCHE